uniref:Adrenopeptidine n=1 Tax=Mesocricetus auratus TaxID=10036 RepID=Q6X1B9_MESAU|nr:adrenopeptidine [Mesocricetus auratus]
MYYSVAPSSHVKRIVVHTRLINSKSQVPQHHCWSLYHTSHLI